MLRTSSDIFRGRLNRLTTLPIPADTLPLLAAVLAEIGNNSFDHNLGLWPDDPGVWFELQERPPFLWACLADRGQGVRSSLRRAGRDFSDDTEALTAAYEHPHLSGRFPEHRGNSLKFVRRIVLSDPRWGLACRSGQGLVAYGDLAAPCLNILEKSSPRIPGTLTLVCLRYAP